VGGIKFQWIKVGGLFFFLLLLLLLFIR
jgi:hypothetical protein